LIETVVWCRKALAVARVAGLAVGLYLMYFLVQYSVWCFFAAVLSFVIYLYFRHERGQSRRATYTTLRARLGAAEAP
jgi:uncharacterized membrane protein